MSSDAEHILDVRRIENLTVRDFHHTFNSRVERESQRVIANDTDRSETNVRRITILVEVREEKVGVDLIALEELKGFLDLG